ncbi:GH25 family lysozyme M1 (1,4-beta-N-acetylmuramidase) [Bacillus aryabhattai]|uniref:GH25 family lysozyme M1 (1,4-beta-N-acetylmuramidase) n=1 Tax=Priestia aryabhattai TaxID=412384 RepID=A0A7W3NAF0_PRIAR|nr:hypothetical protein [Priestia aryabhattai]MBA9039367.1 GH25 family lysozyme M1 (1,4-beta-N-acetylmuramidase) [Priestia aryabhattai]
MQKRNSKNIKMIDVSHYNGTINWTKVTSDGAKGQGGYSTHTKVPVK